MFGFFKAKPALGHEQLAHIQQLRIKGKLHQAERILLKAEPSPAVADEMRKIASARAKDAKTQNDWEAVIKYLEQYNSYAQRVGSHCLKSVNQEPPSHSASDIKLLAVAKQKLALR